jgi:multiple antibiotic resistance protein
MRKIVEFAASAIVMLLVTIGPLETAATFGVLTAGARRRRVRLALQAVAIGGGILIVFAIGGTESLQLLQVSVPAFEVAAGILLLLQSIELIFARAGSRPSPLAKRRRRS